MGRKKQEEFESYFDEDELEDDYSENETAERVDGGGTVTLKTGQEEKKRRRASKDDSLKDDSLKTSPSKTNSSKTSSPKTNSSKTSSSKTNSSKTSSSKTNPSKTSSSKTSSSKTSSSKTSSSKTSSLKTSPSKTSSSKTSSLKTNPSKTSPSKTKSSKEKTLKAKSLKTKSSKEKTLKAESSKANLSKEKSSKTRFSKANSSKAKDAGRTGKGDAKAVKPRAAKSGATKSGATKSSRIKNKDRRKLKRMDAIDKVAAAVGALIVVFGVIIGSLYGNAKAVEKQVAAFCEVGAQMEGITVIGESGLLAMADAQTAKTALEEAALESGGKEEYEEKELDAEGSVNVEMHLSSMQKDLKIKFVNKKTGKLVPNIAFEVTVTGADRKSIVLTDDDMDGIIYKTDVAPGTCTVELKTAEEAGGYEAAASSGTVTIKDKIEYKKVDVADEVKKESEVNAAAEDTKKQETAEESSLTDTVIWAESAKTLVAGETDANESGTDANESGTDAGSTDAGAAYEEIPKDSIADPMKSGSAANLLQTANQEEGTDIGLTDGAGLLDYTIKAGESVTVTPAMNLQGTVVAWTSTNPDVAKVQDGVVTAVTAGTVEITAVTDTGSSTACKVTVSADPKQDGVTKLKDSGGNQVYVVPLSGETQYREAVSADYYTAEKFYKKVENTAQSEAYKYTGWQTIDGKTYYYDADGKKVTGEQVIQGAKYNFDSEGVLSTASGNMGIDVSKWNGVIDWNAVKNSGVSYVIIRCGYRGSTTGALIEDPMFRSNIQGASAAGLKVGIYFFTQAVNEVEAVEEASMVAGLIAGHQISYPVFLDVEPSGGRADGIGRETRTAVIRAFCQTIQNSGYTAGFYANHTWLTSEIDTGSLTDYKIWLAQYAAEPTYSATRYDLWQYSAKGTVAGIKGSVDMNISHLGY